MVSPKDKLLMHAAGMIRRMDSPEGVLFSEWLDDIRVRENRKLMESDKQELMFRAQGSVGTIDLIKSLRRDLKQYEKDLRAGKVQPIKEEVSDGLVRQG